MEYTLGNGNLESTKTMTEEQVCQSLHQPQMTAMAHCLENVQTEAHTTVFKYLIITCERKTTDKAEY